MTALSTPIEYKRIDPIYIKNFVRLFITGNPDWMIPAGFKERRWAIFDMGTGSIQDHAYFAAIDEEMNNGGREALLHHLLEFDLTKVNLRQIPKTAALFEQQIELMTPEQSWWLDTLMNGALPHKPYGVADREDLRQGGPPSALHSTRPADRGESPVGSDQARHIPDEEARHRLEDDEAVGQQGTGPLLSVSSSSGMPGQVR